MKNKQDILIELPEEYHMDMLPESVDLVIPHFKNSHPYPMKTLAPRKRDCKQWYNEFIDRIIEACGHKYLPICRAGDGEFLFWFGRQPLDIRTPLLQRFRHILSRIKWGLILKGGLGPNTQGHYHSGHYSAKEWRQARLECPGLIREICQKGILAPQTLYTDQPFGERYFPVFDRWLKEHEIELNDDNYYPQYFIYSMFTGPRRGEILKNRRVLVINGAQGETKQKIIDGLKREGVSEVLWCQISYKRSLYDKVDVEPYIGKVDLALIGAGLGKTHILPQLEPLNIPCIDAGFVFEVWKDPQNKFVRVFCATDEEREEFNKKFPGFSC